MPLRGAQAGGTGGAGVRGQFTGLVIKERG